MKKIDKHNDNTPQSRVAVNILLPIQSQFLPLKPIATFFIKTSGTPNNPRIMTRVVILVAKFIIPMPSAPIVLANSILNRNDAAIPNILTTVDLLDFFITSNV